MVFERKAQGTIEYLIIIAIVVVIALATVSVIMSLTSGSAAVSDNSTKLNIASMELAVGDYSAGLDGNLVIKLRNNTASNITVSKMRINLVDHNFSGMLFVGDSKLFMARGVTPCINQKTSYDITIYYSNSYGISKTEVLPTLAVACEPSISAISGAFTETP